MTELAEYLIAGLLVLGGSFGLIGSFGLLKLKAPMQRLHAPTKATTIGVGSVLVAAALSLALLGQGFAWQELLVSAFLFLTAPLSAFYLAKTHILRSIDRAELPVNETGASWATLPQDGDKAPSPRKA